MSKVYDEKLTTTARDAKGCAVMSPSAYLKHLPNYWENHDVSKVVVTLDNGTVVTLQQWERMLLVQDMEPGVLFKLVSVPERTYVRLNESSICEGNFLKRQGEGWITCAYVAPRAKRGRVTALTSGAQVEIVEG